MVSDKLIEKYNEANWLFEFSYGGLFFKKREWVKIRNCKGAENCFEC